jgi:hypothetical protein
LTAIANSTKITGNDKSGNGGPIREGGIAPVWEGKRRIPLQALRHIFSLIAR